MESAWTRYPSFQDKVAQRAIVMLMEPIYEQDFMDCLFGFRSGRSAHGALAAIREAIVMRCARGALDDDAERVLEVLGRRMGKYGLELHANKTRVVDFRFRPKSVGDDRKRH